MRERVWAAVAIGSIVAIAASMRPVDRAEPDHRAPLRPLFTEALEADEVAVMEIRRGGKFARRERGASWRGDARARVRLLLNARLERVVAPDTRAGARFGLAPPSLWLRVYGPTPDRLLLELRVGDRAPDELSYFVEAQPGSGISKLPAYQIDNLRDLLEFATAD